MTRFSIFLAAGVSAVALASAANAADLIIEEPMVPMVETYDSSWDGFYLGVFGGYAQGEVYDEDGDDLMDLDGSWIAGITAGADFTLTDGIVVGVVADATYLGLEGLVEVLPGEPVAADLFWAGSLRGKLGFDGGAFLPYLTAGLAIGYAEVEGSGIDIAGSDSATHVGWTAGAGVEFAVTEDVSIDLLYKYTDYGTQEYTLDEGLTPGTIEAGATTHAVTMGVNWRF